MTFSGCVTIDNSDVHASGQGHGYDMMHKVWSGIEEMPYCFGVVIHDCNCSFNLQMATKWCTKLEMASKKILTQNKRFRTGTPVWIHRWLQNDAQSLERSRRGAILFCKSSINFWVTRAEISMIWTQIERLRTVTSILIHRWVRNDSIRLSVRQSA